MNTPAISSTRREYNIPGDFLSDNPHFLLTKNDIFSIIFTDTLDGMPAAAWDITACAGKVMAWVLPAENGMFTLCVGAEGGVNIRSCQKMFCGYPNVKTIDFSGCIHTDYVTDRRRRSDVHRSLLKSALSNADFPDAAKTDTSDCCKFLYQPTPYSFPTHTIDLLDGITFSEDLLTNGIPHFQYGLAPLDLSILKIWNTDDKKSYSRRNSRKSKKTALF